MPTIMPTHASALLAQIPLSEPVTEDRKLKIARFVLQAHDPMLKRPPMPERPAMLTLDDRELIEAYRSQSSGMSLGADKRRQLSYFGTWRAAVWSAELKACMHLVSLLDSALIFERADLHDESDMLFSYAEEQFLISRADVPRTRFWFDVRQWCETAARDLAVLPMYLRTMTVPRGGIPHPQQRQQAEPQERGGQGKLW